MDHEPLLRAWLVLVGLSAGSASISLWAWPSAWAPVAGLVILTLAWLKARVILSRYLGLAGAPFWLRGFDLSLALFCLLLLALYLVPAFRL